MTGRFQTKGSKPRVSEVSLSGFEAEMTPSSDRKPEKCPEEALVYHRHPIG